MSACNIAVCEVILADMLHNKLAQILTLLSDTREYCWTDFTATGCVDLICLHHCVLSFSSSLLYLSSSLQSLAGTHAVWHKPCRKVPFLPFITIVGTDLLHRGSHSPEDPLDFHAGKHMSCMRARTHTIRENTEEDNGYIIFTFLFINNDLVLSSWRILWIIYCC